MVKKIRFSDIGMTSSSFPEQYLITPDWALDRLQRHMVCTVDVGVKLIQLRACSLSESELEYLLRWWVSAEYSAQLLVNSCFPGAVSMAEDFGVGLHLKSNELMQLKCRPLGEDFLVAASCHNLAELKKAEVLGLDFAVLSPVKKTPSHPESIPIGWQQFKDWGTQVALPVYALGGMRLNCLKIARDHGARGIAGISLFSSMG